MSVNLLTEHNLEFLSLKGSCRGSSESTHVKMPHCWESHATAHIQFHLSFRMANRRIGLSANVHSACKTSI